jgi:hypothetical protein
MGHRCGYVAIPRGHVLHGCDYSDESDALTFPADEAVGKRGVIPLLCGGGKARPDVVFDVHGGITFAGGADDYPVANDGTLWWFGYDCGHAGDAPSDEHIAKRRAEYPDKPYMWGDRDGVHRSLAYCIAECESLAQQLIDRVKVTP